VKQETGLEFSLFPVLTNDVHSFRLTLQKPFFLFFFNIKLRACWKCHL